MSQQFQRDAGVKRKADELNKKDDQPSTQNTNQNLVKKVKTPDNVEAQSSSHAIQVKTLITGGIYRVQCPELGDFHIRAGATGSFRVKAAGLKISNKDETIFPHPAVTLLDGAEVELKDNLSGITTLSVLPERPKSPPQNQNWLTNLFSEVIRGSSAATTSLNIIGSVDKEIILNGGTDVMVIANGGRLKFLGSGSVNVKGFIQSVENDGAGRVTVNGTVTEQVIQTGSGSIQVNEDVIGIITNSGGGSIEVKGKHRGDNKQLNNSRGTIWIGTGKNNGGIKEYYHTKNYKIIQL